MDNENFRERWLVAPLALAFAEEIAQRNGGISGPIGAKLLELAALGKLSVLAKEWQRVAELSKEEITENEKERQELSEDEFWDRQMAKSKERKAISEAASIDLRHIPSWWWAAFLAARNEEQMGEYFVQQTLTNFDREGYFSWIMTSKRYPHETGVDVIFSDPKFDMQSVRGAYFLEHDIYNIVTPSSRSRELRDSSFDLDRADFVDATIDNVGTPTTEIAPLEPAQAKQPKGGRRGGKHGEAIAKVSRQLARLSEVELERYTAVALSVELRDAYLKVGGTPPSDDNLERYSAGILREFRS